MADTGLFGTAVGFRQYDEDQAHLAQLAAGTRLATAHAQKYEEDAALAKKQSEILSQVASGMPVEEKDVANVLEAQAMALARAGMGKQADDLAKGAAEIRLKRQQTLTSGAQGDYRKMQVQRDILNEIDSLVSGVKDQASFDTAKMIFMGRHPGAPLPQELNTYDPAMIERLSQTTKTGLKQLELKLKQAEADSRDEHRDAQNDFYKFREKYMNRRLQQADEREKRLSKVTGPKAKDVGSPTVGERADARTLISQEFPNLPPAEEDQASFEIASRARQIRKTSPGIDASTALNQALNEARKDFSVLDKTYLGFKDPFGKKVSAYKAADKPIPLPARGTKLTIGQVYQTAQGPGKWNGQGFTKVGGRAAPAPAADEEDDSEEE